MNKPLKVAAICGTLSLIIALVFGIISNILVKTDILSIKYILSIFYFFIMLALGVLTFNGFIVLGKKFDSKLLVVMSWISICFMVLFFFFMVLSNIIALNSNQESSSKQELIPRSNENSNFFTDSNGDITPEKIFILIILLIVWVIFSALYGSLLILTGVGFLKLKNKVDLSYSAGILNIISGATIIIFIGFLINIAASIVEVIMLYKASKKYEYGIQKKNMLRSRH